jgi:hypothetical protein
MAPTRSASLKKEIVSPRPLGNLIEASIVFCKVIK